MRFNKNALYIALIAAVSGLLVYRWFSVHAFFSCQEDDTVIYLNWVRQVSESLGEGAIYPRWMPESHGGYGSPAFIFYPPAGILLPAIFMLLTGDVVLSTTIVGFLGLFLSGLFMYFFIGDIRDKKAGLVAALVYMALPFRVFQLYIMGVHASKLSYVFFPLLLHFARKAVREERTGKATVSLSACYALLCLTHLLSAYMISPVVLAFGLLSAGRGRRLAAAGRVCLAILLGLALSATYVLPAFSERPFAHFDELVNKPWLEYWNTYVFYLFRPALLYIPSFNEYLARAVLASALLGLSVYLAFEKTYPGGGRGPEPVFFMAVVAGTLFLMSSLSGFLWPVAPGLRMLQFPARWASVCVFGTACLAGAGVGRTEKTGLDKRRTLKGPWVMLLAVSVVLAVYYDQEIVRHGCFYSKEEVKSLRSDMDVLGFIPRGASLSWLREELKKPAGERIIPQTGEKLVRMDVNYWGPERRDFSVGLDSDTTLRVRTFYYPGWRAFIDGREASISTEAASGAMLLAVPKGGHEVTLSFSDTPDRKLAMLISAIAAVSALYLYARPRFFRGRPA